ncbi:MAG: hypothetical protein IT577_23825 [Verrucomicrobiae bacterium]|nr:hypothetical protein [Verrucomicrobiae bacterium]
MNDPLNLNGRTIREVFLIARPDRELADIEIAFTDGAILRLGAVQAGVLSCVIVLPDNNAFGLDRLNLIPIPLD